jgi:hypothetical protein
MHANSVSSARVASGICAILANYSNRLRFSVTYSVMMFGVPQGSLPGAPLV